jgi:hypothetical protein
LVRKTERSGKKKSSLKERKERAEKMAEGLQKELDALVPPISVKKESGVSERVKALAEKGTGKRISEVSLERGAPALETPIKKEQTKRAERKVNPWGIVIGETD